jgi:hypothetical protein
MYLILLLLCFATGLWFSPGIPVSGTNKTARHDIAEILLKVVLNTITLTLYKKYIIAYLLISLEYA